MSKSQSEAAERAADGSAPPPLRRDGDAVFLDIDGTLTPLRPRPEDVRLTIEEAQCLREARAGFGGALALVSGRGLADIDRIVGGRGFAAAGVHGLERRLADGRMDRADPHPALAGAISDLRAIADRDPGLLVEDKSLGVTLHYRQAPQFEAEAVAAAERLAAQTGLKLQRGDCIVELRTPGRDKGEAVRAFMAESPFTGRRPIFVGDDLTDEDGFEAVAALGGYGVLVGGRTGSAARYRLADPAAVLAWLAQAAERGTGP